MDVLGQLELRVEQLLARLDTLKTENSHLQGELARKCGECDKLATENKTLRDSIRKEEERRLLALERLEALLRKIRDYAGGGHGLGK